MSKKKFKNHYRDKIYASFIVTINIILTLT